MDNEASKRKILKLFMKESLKCVHVDLILLKPQEIATSETESEIVFHYKIMNYALKKIKNSLTTWEMQKIEQPKNIPFLMDVTTDR